MANVKINEFSSNYQYSVGDGYYAVVALPITAQWGPAYMDPNTLGIDKDVMLERTAWSRFPATQAGLEAFVATYRGPSSNYRMAKDYSYQMAMTLLTAGYDVLVCRLCPGANAEGTFNCGDKTLTVKAKYPGTFGNSLQIALKKLPNRDLWNLITYVIDASGTRTAVENLLFVFELDHSENVPHITELDSDFLTFTASEDLKDTDTFDSELIRLTGGTDKAPEAEISDMMDEAIKLATARFKAVSVDESFKGDSLEYIQALNAVKGTIKDSAKAATIRHMEWVYTNALDVYDLLKDKLAYNPNRVISPWDDQNVKEIDGSEPPRLSTLSPLHVKLLDVGYNSRCAYGMIDIPKSLPRTAVWNESTDTYKTGYAQMLSRFVPPNAALDIDIGLYPTHAGLFAPWGTFVYAGTSKQAPATPSFLALMIARAQILNQPIRYEWALPVNRTHNLTIGKLDYNVSKHLLDQWQKQEGVGVNVITNVPEMGINIWGNSTLFELPPSTYQALANMSTRLLVNAVEDVVYRVGISITFQYNNGQAYDKFYAGLTPLLDTMENVGAITGYKVRMSKDLNALDQVNHNTCVGKVYLQIEGVINDIIVDLICLPPSVSLESVGA